MGCAACLTDPLTHSFHSIGTHRKSGVPCSIFYTSYRHIKDYSNSSAISAHITGCLDDISGSPWIWIMDCTYLQAKHMMQIGVAMKLLKLLGNTYGARLQNLYLINSGAIINTALMTLNPFISKEFKESIRKVAGTPLEILSIFTSKYGWSTAEVEPIIRRIRTEHT